VLARESLVSSKSRAEWSYCIRVKLTVNGESRELDDVITVGDVVLRLGLTEGPVAVELNREIVPRAEHASRAVQDGDVLEIVHFVGGG